MENTQTRDALVQLCKDKGIKGYSGKKKAELILMLQQSEKSQEAEKQEESQEAEKQEESQEAEKQEESQEAEEKQEENGALYRMIDLFAGTGAFSHAFHEVSQGTVRGVFANDMVERSKLIYDVNHHHPLTLQDLNEVKVEDIPPHDILTGGFPCQPFSIAGKQEGFQDRRSNVFWKILEILDFHRPACIVLENVKNLVSHDKGNTFQVIRTRLEERGYHLHYKVLNTAEITGIPQHRERIYIVGLRSKPAHDAFAMDFPAMEKQPIQRLLDTDVPDKYYYTADTETGRMVRDQVIRSDTVYQYRRVYVRENKSNECPTLTANMGAGGHNVPLVRDQKGVRKLTPRECFRFQGFPDSYTLPKMSDANLYQLAGNAVSVPVVRLIAQRLLALPLFG